MDDRGDGLIMATIYINTKFCGIESPDALKKTENVGMSVLSILSISSVITVEPHIKRDVLELILHHFKFSLYKNTKDENTYRT